ncbi:hypothetical protein V5799_018270 [Amblyomma americanum]|uniref:Uncharacterized protein n=1 Tax=Amblyomma americanum TaxID=6943 RepID=A0AAQ4F0Y4_AMBAM
MQPIRTSLPAVMMPADPETALESEVKRQLFDSHSATLMSCLALDGATNAPPRDAQPSGIEIDSTIQDCAADGTVAASSSHFYSYPEEYLKEGNPIELHHNTVCFAQDRQECQTFFV